MPLTRSYHHGDLRATLIGLATEHIAAEGVETLSVRALAREADVAHRAAYQHFPDKDALIAATFADAYGRLEALCAATSASAVSPDARLMAVAAAYVAFAHEEQNMFLAMAGPRLNQAGGYKELESAIAKAWRHIAAPIGEGVDSGAYTLADKRQAAALFWGGLQGVLAQAALGRLKVKRDERDAFFREIARRLVNSLKAS